MPDALLVVHPSRTEYDDDLLTRFRRVVGRRYGRRRHLRA